jgi:hypothetical protein
MKRLQHREVPRSGKGRRWALEWGWDGWEPMLLATSAPLLKTEMWNSAGPNPSHHPSTWFLDQFFDISCLDGCLLFMNVTWSSCKCSSSWWCDRLCKSWGERWWRTDMCKMSLKHIDASMSKKYRNQLKGSPMAKSVTIWITKKNYFFFLDFNLKYKINIWESGNSINDGKKRNFLYKIKVNYVTLPHKPKEAQLPSHFLSVDCAPFLLSKG